MEKKTQNTSKSGDVNLQNECILLSEEHPVVLNADCLQSLAKATQVCWV